MADNQILEVIGEFLAESRENMEKAGDELVKLENDPENHELVNSIFRVFHSIKGGAGFMRLEAIAQMTHKLENLLTEVKNNKKKMDKELTSLLLKGVDMISGAINRVDENPDAAAPTKKEKKFITELEVFCETFGKDDLLFQGENMVAALEKLVKEMKETDLDISKHPHMRAILGSMDSIQNEISVKKKKREVNFDCVYKEKDYRPHIRLIFDSIDKLRDRKVTETLLEQIESGLNSLSEVFKEGDPKSLYDETLASYKNIRIGWQMVDDNIYQELFNDFYSHYLSAIKSVFKPLAPARGTRIVPPQEPSQVPEPTEDPGDKIEKKRKEKYIRIQQDKLDMFMNQVGELIIIKDVFNNVHQKFQAWKEGSGRAKDLKAVILQLGKLSMDMHDSVMEIRKLPLRQLFQKFSRLVREVSGQVNKKIVLKVSGDETELDKNLIELLEDPLVHILRNSIDHGIEPTAEDRVKAGKPEEGIISLSAYTDEELGYIVIEDDGRGIDPVKIKQIALKRGIVSEAEAKKMTDNEIRKFIFHPGFSSAEKVTDISGRGVGMDVVMSNLKKCHGSLDLDSTTGVGTKITIKLPQTQTLVIKDAVVIHSEEKLYAIPMEDVEAIAKLEPKSVTHHSTKSFFKHKDQMFKLFHLSNMLNVPKTLPDTDGKKETGEKTVIIIKNEDGGKAALIVDVLERNQKIVARPFDRDYLKTIKEFAGFTIMGDGNVVLILNAEGLITENA